MGPGVSLLTLFAHTGLAPLPQVAPQPRDTVPEVVCDYRRPPVASPSREPSHSAAGQEAPRATICAVAPEFALRDVQGRRRVSEHVFGARGTLLVFLDATDKDGTEGLLQALRHLRARHTCEGIPLVIVDISPAWTRSERRDWPFADVLLRDPVRELASIYLLREPPIVFLLDERDIVQYWTAGIGTQSRLERGYVARFLEERCTAHQRGARR